MCNGTFLLISKCFDTSFQKNRTTLNTSRINEVIFSYTFLDVLEERLCICLTLFKHTWNGKKFGLIFHLVTRLSDIALIFDRSKKFSYRLRKNFFFPHASTLEIDSVINRLFTIFYHSRSRLFSLNLT